MDIQDFWTPVELIRPLHLWFSPHLRRQDQLKMIFSGRIDNYFGAVRLSFPRLSPLIGVLETLRLSVGFFDVSEMVKY